MNAGHEMTILHFENDLKRMIGLEEIEIMKATTSDQVLNSMQSNNNTLYKILQPL